MTHFFNINSIFFTFLGYPLSYLEFFGTIFNLWGVWWTTKRKVACWPIGIVGVILYMFLFYQIQLYSDMVENFYYLVTGFAGWWFWLHPRSERESDRNRHLRVRSMTLRQSAVLIGATFAASLGVGWFMTRIHLILPKLFPEPAAFPYLDALTTLFSFSAQWLTAKKRIENWYIWIAVDVVSAGIYFQRGVKFLALEYVIFLILAVVGLLNWKKEMKTYEPTALAA